MYLFLTFFFCACCTTKSAISDSNALFTLLFFIFEAPNLNIFGMLSIPLFISFWPNCEPIAFNPSSNRVFAILAKIPFPDWDFRLAFVFLKAGAAWLSKTLLLFFLGAIVLCLFTLILIGSCFLLILSHVDVKDLPFGNEPTFGSAFFLKWCFALSPQYSLTSNSRSSYYFFEYRFCNFRQYQDTNRC